MTAKLELCENGHILHYIVGDPWSMTDVQDLNNHAKVYFDAAPQKLHALVDIRAIRTVPPGLLRARSSPALIHPNSGRMAIVGPSNLLRTIAEVVCRLAQFERAKFVISEEEAWAYLRQVIAEEQQTQASPDMVVNR